MHGECYYQPSCVFFPLSDSYSVTYELSCWISTSSPVYHRANPERKTSTLTFIAKQIYKHSTDNVSHE